MVLEAPAKVNLTLKVLGCRADGYHELSSEVVPISLFDTLEVTAAETLVVESPYGERDLCFKAARALDSERGARIRITKRIPAGAGLGGGSSDAAATLIALNKLWRKGLSRAELAEVGARVGSDVPALVWGVPVLMEGRGERITLLAEAPVRDLVLVVPQINLSTAAVYAAHRAETAVMPNELEAAALSLAPELAAVRACLERRTGVRCVAMSGSGSAYFGLFDSPAAAQAAAREIMRETSYDVFSVHTLGGTLELQLERNDSRLSRDVMAA